MLMRMAGPLIRLAASTATSTASVARVRDAKELAPEV
jgi:hypothetical protein